MFIMGRTRRGFTPEYKDEAVKRFARVVRHRPDKTASEADPIELVEALRQS